MHIGKHPLNSFQYISELLIVDGHELHGQTSVAAGCILTDKTIAVEPPDQGGFINLMGAAELGFPRIGGG
jgi:hypothetical protein